MKNIILLSFILLGTFSMAQNGKLRKANRYYKKLSYAYAVPLYEELLGSKVETYEMKSKLARSYYFMGDMVKAELALANVIYSPNVENENIFLYAQTLKQNGKIDVSDFWMNKFKDASPQDLRALSYSQNADYFERIIAQDKKFEIQNLNINTSSADFGGYPTRDGKSAYFVSNRRESAFVKTIWTWNKDRFLDIYVSEIGPFNELEKAEMLSRKTNSKYHEGPLAFTPDGKTVYFTRNNISGGKARHDEQGIQNLKLFRASVNELGEWKDEEELPFNSKEYSVGHPSITSDGKWLYLASDMPGGHGGADIYKVELKQDGGFGILENLGAEVNTEGQDMFPCISDDGNLFFSSDGRIGLGGLDIFVMFPSEKGFTNMMNLGLPINGQKDDFAFTINKDNSSGYFSSNRDGGRGDDDIYSYKLIKPLNSIINLEGVISDLSTEDIIPNVKVDLLDTTGKVLATTFSNENGYYNFGLERNKSYKIEASKDTYFDKSLNLQTEKLEVGVNLIEKNLQLIQTKGLNLNPLISDAKTGKSVDGVRITITDNFTDEIIIVMETPETSDALQSILEHAVGDSINIRLQLVKEGFFPREVSFYGKVSEPGLISLYGMFDGVLTLDKEVKELTEIVLINSINFDLDKYNIRPDAKIELDKIVQIMNKYPLMEVELGSHTDCRADYSYNELLSDQRAKASANYIKSKIVNPDRIYGKGYGESKLLNDCDCEGNKKSNCSDEEHEKNRRTEFRVVNPGGNIEIINNSTNSFDKKEN